MPSDHSASDFIPKTKQMSDEIWQWILKWNLTHLENFTCLPLFSMHYFFLYCKIPPASQYFPCAIFCTVFPFKERSVLLALVVLCDVPAASSMPPPVLHSLEIRGLRSTKCSSETLQNLLYFMYKKIHVVIFVFHFVQLYFLPYECPGLCQHRPEHS